MIGPLGELTSQLSPQFVKKTTSILLVLLIVVIGMAGTFVFLAYEQGGSAWGLSFASIQNTDDLQEQVENLGNQVAMLATATTVEALEARVNALSDQVESEDVVDFGPPEEMKLGEVYQAPSAGIVSANMSVVSGRGKRGIVCGWVASDRGSLLTRDARRDHGLRLAYATVHYSDGDTNLSMAAISMPVPAGQFWTVTRCSGDPGDTVIRTYFHQLGTSVLDRK